MTGIIRVEQVKETLVSLRGQNVILASDVAKLYGVETKAINQAVKNNPDKFPEGFVYELTKTPFHNIFPPVYIFWRPYYFQNIFVPL